MAWLAVAVDWQGADRSDSIRALLRPQAWQRDVALGRNSFASWGRARGAPDPPEGAYHEDGIAVLFDGRIDNQDELVAALGDPPPLSLGEVLARGYRRWHGGLAERMLGDFAVVIADEAKRDVLAFRDASGVRPLAYHTDTSGLIIASDPLQLLGLPQVSRALDADTVVEHLLRRGTSLERTFFRDIKRVPPGHELIARTGLLKVEPFVRPPVEDPRLETPEVVLEELRLRLLESVRVRARGPRPVAAYLSGGIDSSVIVCAAAALAREGKIDPLAYTLSARYPGSPNDEGAFMNLVTKHTGIQALEWDGTRRIHVPGPLEASEPPFLTMQTGDETPDWTAVISNGIRVVLDGVGGDEIGAFPGVMDDLGRLRRWKAAAERILENGIDRRLRERRAWALVRGWSAAALPKLHARSRSFRARTHTLPRWLSAEGRKRARASIDRGWTGGGPFASGAQGWLWGRVTAPFFINALERLHRRGTFMTVDWRFPFLDRRVVDLILRVPINYRLHHPYRRLQQSAMASLLPPAIAQRVTKANFDGSLVDRVRAAAPIIEQTLATGPWLSAPFVDRAEARATAHHVLANTDDLGSRAFEAVSKITALELWLRQLG
jgi:asparagine synthase (glutamine-hydrolysing)